MAELSEILLENDVEFKKDFLLATLSTFRIGGKADMVAYPDSAEKLIAVIRAARTLGTSFEVVGNCSNLLFSDKGYRGVIVSTERMRGVEFFCDRVKCSAGVSLPLLAKNAAHGALSGLEFASGIPASVGGAVFMNAGAHGLEISDMLISSRAYDADNDRVVTLNNAEHKFSYRHSVYADNSALVCLEAELALVVGDSDAIFEKMREYSEKRRSTQPLSMPSAGSFFKRPEGYFAAKLIDDCGLKGLRVGGAAVSEKHAGFIVNLGGATASDVLELSSIVSDKVYAVTGVRLEREVIFIGEV